MTRLRRPTVIAIVLVFAGSGCSPGGPSGPFTLTGEVQLLGNSSAHQVVAVTDINHCYGVGVNGPFVVYTHVAVRAGSVVRRAQLSAGEIIFDKNPVLVDGCRFPFRVTGVPPGKGTYTLRIDGVATRTLSEAAARRGVTLRFTR